MWPLGGFEFQCLFFVKLTSDSCQAVMHIKGLSSFADLFLRLFCVLLEVLQQGKNLQSEYDDIYLLIAPCMQAKMSPGFLPPHPAYTPFLILLSVFPMLSYVCYYRFSMLFLFTLHFCIWF